MNRVAMSVCGPTTTMTTLSNTTSTPPSTRGMLLDDSDRPRRMSPPTALQVQGNDVLQEAPRSLPALTITSSAKTKTSINHKKCRDDSSDLHSPKNQQQHPPQQQVLSVEIRPVPVKEMMEPSLASLAEDNPPKICQPQTKHSTAAAAAATEATCDDASKLVVPVPTSTITAAPAAAAVTTTAAAAPPRKPRRASDKLHCRASHQQRQQQQQQRQPSKRQSVASVASAPASAPERRRSSRKSINGLVIEFDIEDQDYEAPLFANCDDYQDNYKPTLEHGLSSDSLEEFRTQLEALEHERPPETLLLLPEQDDDYSGLLGQECVHKKFMEALEGSNATMDYCHASSLRDIIIPEEEDNVMIPNNNHNHNHNHNNHHYQHHYYTSSGDDDDDDHSSQEEGVSASSTHQQNSHPRRSTVRSRSSILGLVLEYDWTTDEEEEEQQHSFIIDC